MAPPIATVSPSAAPSASVPTQPSPTAVEPTAAPSSDAPATAEPTDAATLSPSDEPEVTPAGTTGPAELCTGSSDNQRFFAEAADGVDWAVYCPVLPDRWFVDSGRRGGAGGGWLTISYEGPGDARLELSEGAFCQDADGCVPFGAEIGLAPFGDQVGTFVAGDDGSFSIVVDRADPLSWLATGTGLDEGVFREFVAGLNHVED